MTFKELNEKLQKDFTNSGCYAVFDDWYKNIKKWNNYDNLYGMVWGLRVVGYISDDEWDILTEEFIRVSNSIN